jgi:hypothetical protein
MSQEISCPLEAFLEAGMVGQKICAFKIIRAKYFSKCS